jgi:tellurite resistance protein
VAAKKARKTTRVRSTTKRVASRTIRSRVMTLDQAIIAVLIGSMMANGHVSPEESERAHHITWSMRRFRRRSGDTVGRLIESVRQRVVVDGPVATVSLAAKVIPASTRPSVLAVAADLMLVDGTLQRQERQFLGELARQLKIAPALSLQIVKAISIKNSI